MNESAKPVNEKTWKERCQLLVLENDELMAENMLRKKYEGFLLSVIRSGEKLNDGEDFEWFKRYLGSSSILSEVFK